MAVFCVCGRVFEEEVKECDRALPENPEPLKAGHSRMLKYRKSCKLELIYIILNMLLPAIVLIFGWSLLFFMLFQVYKAYRHGSHFQMPSISIKRLLTPRTKYRNAPNTGEFQHKLLNQLLALVQGDTTVAQRLLSQTRQRYPNKTDTWCLKKVVWDLERDRH